MRKKPKRTWKHLRFRQYELPGILLLLFLSLLVMFFRYHRRQQYIPLSAADVFLPELQAWYADSFPGDTVRQEEKDRLADWMHEQELVTKPAKRAEDDRRSGEGKFVVPSSPKSAPRAARIEINSSDSADFLPLYGIGPVYSGRIVKYRNLLGGFYSLYQLSEVYGLDSSVVWQNRERLRVDTLAIQAINLNTASWLDLVRHPYIDRQQANDILALRKHLGGELTSVKQLWQNRIFTPEDYFRLHFYLALDAKGVAKTP